MYSLIAKRYDHHSNLSWGPWCEVFGRHYHTTLDGAETSHQTWCSLFESTVLFLYGSHCIQTFVRVDTHLPFGPKRCIHEVQKNRTTWNVNWNFQLSQFAQLGTKLDFMNFSRLQRRELVNLVILLLRFLFLPRPKRTNFMWVSMLSTKRPVQREIVTEIVRVDIFPSWRHENYTSHFRGCMLIKHGNLHAIPEHVCARFCSFVGLFVCVRVFVCVCVCMCVCDDNVVILFEIFCVSLEQTLSRH